MNKKLVLERIIPPKQGFATVVSRPGDYIELRMEMDCIMALSSCPMDVIAPTNGCSCTPLKVETHEEMAGAQ